MREMTTQTDLSKSPLHLLILRTAFETLCLPFPPHLCQLTKVFGMITETSRLWTTHRPKHCLTNFGSGMRPEPDSRNKYRTIRCCNLVPESTSYDSVACSNVTSRACLFISTLVLVVATRCAWLFLILHFSRSDPTPFLRSHFLAVFTPFELIPHHLHLSQQTRGSHLTCQFGPLLTLLVRLVQRFCSYWGLQQKKNLRWYHKNQTERCTDIFKTGLQDEALETPTICFMI